MKRTKNSKITWLVMSTDKINIKLTEAVIKRYDSSSNIQKFETLEAGLDFVKRIVPVDNCIYLALTDLYTDTGMDGRDFMNSFTSLNVDIQENVLINIMSSSISQKDMLWAQEHEKVVCYLIKPLTKETIGLVVTRAKNGCILE
ncbi:MAG: hypothetical protein KBC17_01800 [Candidatus Pacebacteria bacterium]|nr:hypothetical protein [Candidatus Paceibacterota bacterium]